MNEKFAKRIRKHLAPTWKQASYVVKDRTIRLAPECGRKRYKLIKKAARVWEQTEW